MTDEDWIANEELEDKLHNMYKVFENSPLVHLYDWLQVVNPEVFKQWQAVFDIEKGVN